MGCSSTDSPIGLVGAIQLQLNISMKASNFSTRSLYGQPFQYLVHDHINEYDFQNVTQKNDKKDIYIIMTINIIYLFLVWSY